MATKQTYIFTGVECMIGERILCPGYTIELSDEEYRNAVEGGAALQAVPGSQSES